MDRAIEASPLTKQRHPMDKQKSKLYNLISQFYVTEKFIQALFNWTIYRKTKKLKTAHFEMINDLAFYPEGWISFSIYDMTMTLKFFFKPLIKGAKDLVIKKREFLVFHPTSFFRVFWDFLHSIFIIAYLIIIPLELSFEVSVHKELPYNLSAVILVFFLLDILVNLNTAIYEQGKLTIYYKKIMIKYFRSNCLLDSISILYFFEIN